MNAKKRWPLVFSIAILMILPTIFLPGNVSFGKDLSAKDDCDFTAIRRVVHATTERKMTLQQLAAGAEWDEELIHPDSTTTRQETNFVMETGVKFRVNITKAPPPLNFLGAITEFWGPRAGIKNTGFADIDKLTYVIEFGAGVW